jgi:type I restriction enzyme S subunit
MILAKYDSYKDSGVEWLGEIPGDWEIKRIKDVSNLKSGDTITSEQFVKEGYPVYGGNGFRGFFKNYNLNGYYILIGRQGALCGNINYAKDKIWASEHAVVVYHSEDIDTFWYGELLRIMNLNQYSLSAAQPGLSVEKISQLKMPFPPYKLQIKISNFIDKKTTQLDVKINILKQKKTSYEELKKTLINETVCRGINKNVELKDSGIEWIGKIPKYWKLLRVKDIYTESKSLSSTGKEDLLSVSEYTGVTKRKKDNETGENSTRADTLVGYKLCKKGDLIINIMLAWKKGLGVSPCGGIVSPAYGVYLPILSINTKYFHYLFRTDMYIAEFKRNSTGIINSRLRLYSDSFFSIHAIVPPKEEQIKIANYLDEKTSKIDKIIEKINDQISTLTEFRKTLINDVVTGKIKVAK